MGLIQDMLKRAKEANEPRNIDNEDTNDRVLISLRHERKKQLEVMEKEELKHTIANHKKQIVRERLWGIKDEMAYKKRQMVKASLDKKVNVLANRDPILKQKSMLREDKNLLSGQTVLRSKPTKKLTDKFRI